MVTAPITNLNHPLFDSQILSRRADDFVERFESARAQDANVDLGTFLPPDEDPEYVPISIEMLRIDLELSWQAGTPKSVVEYQQTHASLLSDPQSLQALAFEEYRMRLQAGESIQPYFYERTYDVDTKGWPTQVTTDLANDATLTMANLAPEISRLEQAIQPFPEVGDEFGGFHLVEQIGRGTFGRVYLATQDDLASRNVVVKITTTRSLEPERLARLQHSHIVPIYSVHQDGPLHAICMPYLGRTTLSNVLRQVRTTNSLPTTGTLFAETIEAQRDMPVVGNPTASEARLSQLRSASYVDACLTLAEALGKGLRYAHDRGIVHRDLKPANVLLTNNGEPMLLDFNISDESVAGERSCLFVGGTLPYMSPEHLRSLIAGTATDTRSDIYSFGVILFELLTGQRPFMEQHESSATLSTTLAEMAELRQRGAPDVRSLNSTVPPSVAAIVNKCLAANVKARYQAMADVCEDLQRQQRFEPLKFAENPSLTERLQKFGRRHPKLMSHASLAGISLVIIFGMFGLLVANSRHTRRIEADRTVQGIEATLPELRVLLSSLNSDPLTLERGREVARQLLATANVPDSDPAWAQFTQRLSQLPKATRQPLQERVAEVLYLLAASERKRQSPNTELANKLNEHAQTLFADGHIPAALKRQQQTLEIAMTEHVPWTLISNSQTETPPPNVEAINDENHFTVYEALHDRIPSQTALNVLEHLRREQPHDFSNWLLLGDAHLKTGNWLEAKTCYDSCVLLWPNSYLSHFHRGVGKLTQQQYVDAIQDFTAALKLDPELTAARLNRGIAYLRNADYQLAIDDFTTALEKGAKQSRIYLLRAEAHDKLDDDDNAARDREIAMQTPPTDAVSCVAVGMAILKAQPEEALKYFQQAADLDPQLRSAQRNLAHVLGERLDENEQALKVVDQLVKNSGGRADDHISRAVYHARLGHTAAATADVREAIRAEPSAKVRFQAACVYALLSNEDPQAEVIAVGLLGQAVQQEPRWLSVALLDPDLQSIRGTDAFRELIRAASTIRRSVHAGIKELETPPSNPVQSSNSESRSTTE